MQTLQTVGTPIPITASATPPTPVQLDGSGLCPFKVNNPSQNNIWLSAAATQAAALAQANAYISSGTLTGLNFIQADDMEVLSFQGGWWVTAVVDIGVADSKCIVQRGQWV